MVVFTSLGEYILQAPHPTYQARWSACDIPPESRFRAHDTSTSVVPSWMDAIYYHELRQDQARWQKAGKAFKPPVEPPSTDVAILQSQGTEARLRADKRALGPKLSASINAQDALHQQVMAHPIPQNSNQKWSLEQMIVKKKEHDLQVKSLFQRQRELTSAIEAHSGESSQVRGAHTPAQYVVVPDNDAGPSVQCKFLAANKEVPRDAKIFSFYHSQAPPEMTMEDLLDYAALDSAEASPTLASAEAPPPALASAEAPPAFGWGSGGGLVSVFKLQSYPCSISFSPLPPGARKVRLRPRKIPRHFILGPRGFYTICPSPPSSPRQNLLWWAILHPRVKHKSENLAAKSCSTFHISRYLCCVISSASTVIFSQLNFNCGTPSVVTGGVQSQYLVPSSSITKN